MKYINNFNTHKKRIMMENRYNSNILLLEGVVLSNNDENLFKNILNKFVDSHKNLLIKEEIKEYLKISNLLNEGFLNEGFFDKLKDRFPKAAEVSKLLSDKAEQALGNILSKVKDAVSFVKKLGEGIKEFFISVIEKGKTYFTEQIQSGKLKDKISELASSKKDGLVTDLKKTKDIIEFYRKTFMGKLLGNTEKGMTDFLSQEQEPVAESIVNEGKNVISTLVHKIEEIPPFSWLHKVAQIGEAGAAKLINVISKLTEKLGGPSFELPVIALLIGVVFEQFIKGQAGHWLIDLAGSATPLGIAIKGLKMVAFFIALIIALDATIGNKILGGHDDHSTEHETETQGQKQTETQDQNETQDDKSNKNKNI